jgi:hypothetical protein
LQKKEGSHLLKVEVYATVEGLVVAGVKL